MTYASATPAQKRAVQDAAAILAVATEPTRIQFNGSGVKNGYDAEALGATMSNALAACGIGSGALGPTQAIVTDAQSVSVRTRNGTITATSVANVSGGSLGTITLPTQTTLVVNNDSMPVQNSAGTAVAGTHPATVGANGGVTAVKLASTVAPVVSGVKINAGTVTGSGNFATITVANGVITGIVLSAS